MTFQQVQKYESAKNRVNASRLYEIAQRLDVLAGWFFDDFPDDQDMKSGETSLAYIVGLVKE